MERNTHKETWSGETSLKERFTVRESEVQNIMNDNYNIEKVKKEMEKVKGLSTTQADDWARLAREVTQVISSKQLVPTMRTQVRISLFQISIIPSVKNFFNAFNDINDFLSSVHAHSFSNSI